MSSDPSDDIGEKKADLSGTERPGGRRKLSEESSDFEITSEIRYEWPPPRDRNLNFKTKPRNPVQSIITALPVLMLVAGLFLYYRGESQQIKGEPIGSESITLVGTYTGMSATSGRHYLWLEQEGKPLGLRVTPEQAALTDSLERGISLSVQAAPRVHGSRTLWAWYIEQSGTVLVDDSEALIDSE